MTPTPPNATSTNSKTSSTASTAAAATTTTVTPTPYAFNVGVQGTSDRLTLYVSRVPTCSVPSANGDQPEPAVEAEILPPPAPAPIIHLPGRELETESAENGDQPVVPKKRPTRRGSRGGRNRKKKTATSPSAEVEAEAPPAEAKPDAGEWEYTPMSEWGHE